MIYKRYEYSRKVFGIFFLTILFYDKALTQNLVKYSIQPDVSERK